MAEVTRYSSEEMNSGNESNETHLWTEQERQADFNRHKEELMKRKRRRKKRTSSSIQSSCFQGKDNVIIKQGRAEHPLNRDGRFLNSKTSSKQ